MPNSEPKKARRAKSPDFWKGIGGRPKRPLTEKQRETQRKNAQNQRPGRITPGEYEQIQGLKRDARGKAFPTLLRKTVAAICGTATWGDPTFEAAAVFLADRCGLPKETVQDLKLQAGAGPVIRFEIVRPEAKPVE